MVTPPAQAAHVSPQQLALRESKLVSFVTVKEVDNSKTYFLSAANFTKNMQNPKVQQSKGQKKQPQKAKAAPRLCSINYYGDLVANFELKLSREQALSVKSFVDSAATANDNRVKKSGNETEQWAIETIKNGMYYGNVGAWFYNSGHYDLALECANRGLSYQPYGLDVRNIAQLLFIKGAVLAWNLQLGEALKAFDESLKFDPFDKDTKKFRDDVAKAFEQEKNNAGGSAVQPKGNKIEPVAEISRSQAMKEMLQIDSIYNSDMKLLADQEFSIFAAKNLANTLKGKVSPEVKKKRDELESGIVKAEAAYNENIKTANENAGIRYCDLAGQCLWSGLRDLALKCLNSALKFEKYLDADTLKLIRARKQFLEN